MAILIISPETKSPAKVEEACILLFHIGNTTPFIVSSASIVIVGMTKVKPLLVALIVVQYLVYNFDILAVPEVSAGKLYEVLTIWKLVEVNPTLEIVCVPL